MQPKNIYYPDNSIYPGEYTPIQHKFDMLVEELSKPHEGASNPACNIRETSEYFKIELAAPGLKREDFYVSINENRNLSISSLHEEMNRIENENYYEYTFNYECFNRELLLPENIDTDFIRAEYRAGILSILFLKTEKQYQSRISTIIIY